MPQQLTPYHINQQRADALLGPMVATVGELAARAAHYLERLNFADADRAALESAQAALSQAHAELDRLRQAAGDTGR